MNAATPLSCDTAGLPKVDEALSLILTQCPPVSDPETIPLSLALGRVLAQDAHALLTVPPCDRSAMDGYAYRFGGASLLRLAGTVRAGAPYGETVDDGECVAIATGGALPNGCDTVAVRERCLVTCDGIRVTAKGRGANVRHKGEDFHAGDVLAMAGVRLGSRQLALLAAAGIQEVTVRPQLRIAILSVGDELLASTADSIRDANRPMLISLCERQGFSVHDLGILPDHRNELASKLALVARSYDAIIISAGTSAGDGDHVCGALLDCGGRIQVSGVAIRPGKPVSFGRICHSQVIALPGNPSAAYITFLALGLPLLHHLSGEARRSQPWQKVQTGFSHRKKSGLREYLRVRLDWNPDGACQVQTCSDNGPAMLTSLCEADGLVMLEEDCLGFEAGASVPFASFDTLEAR